MRGILLHKTNGIPKKYKYNGDKTNVTHEQVGKKQMAKRGMKRVHAMTSGRENEGNKSARELAGGC